MNTLAVPNALPLQALAPPGLVARVVWPELGGGRCERVDIVAVVRLVGRVAIPAPRRGDTAT